LGGANMERETISYTWMKTAQVNAVLGERRSQLWMGRKASLPPRGGDDEKTNIADKGARKNLAISQKQKIGKEIYLR